MIKLQKYILKVVFPPVLSAVAVQGAVAQEPTIYAAVLSNKKFVVGSTNPQTGIFYSKTQNLQWQHTCWNNARVFSLAVDPASNGKTIWAACGNGAMKSTDGGKTWKITTNWEVTEVLQVCIDPTNSKIVYIGTAYGVFKTTDGGKTWQRKTKGLKEPSDTFTSALLIDKAQPKVIFAGTENGLYVSKDAGESWSAIGGATLRGKGIRRLVQSLLNPKILMVGTENDGVFKSTDSGETWQQMNKGLEHLTVYALAFDPKNDSIIYAGGYGGGVYKTTDGGQSWTNSSMGFDILDIHSLAVDPVNTRVIFAGTTGGGIFRSIDAGQTWQHAGLEGASVWNIVIQ